MSVDTESPSSLPASFLQTEMAWVLLPFVAYLVAIPCLGGDSLFVPIVVILAPIGIISYFDPSVMEDWSSLGSHALPIALIHACFWILLTVGLEGRRRFSLPRLRMIWFTLVSMLIMSVGGCATHPETGLRSPGNWH